MKDILQSNNFSVNFYRDLFINLTVEASEYGIGAVISHVFENGEERPICFASKTLNDQQKRWSQIDEEAYSIIFGVKRYEFLHGYKFTFVTDNKA